jgi:hypothetical protein
MQAPRRRGPNLCGLYIFREGSGGSMELELVLDLFPLSRTIGGDYLFTWVEPGTHARLAGTDEDMALSFKAQANSLVFVRQEAMGSWTIASQLTLVSSDESQRAVRGCVRADRPPDQGTSSVDPLVARPSSASCARAACAAKRLHRCRHFKTPAAASPRTSLPAAGSPHRWPWWNKLGRAMKIELVESSRMSSGGIRPEDWP